MNKILKKTLSIILAVVMIATTIPFAFAAGVVASGDCGAQGNNVTWTLDSDGLLTISGKGEMCEIFIYADQPWKYMHDNIREVIIEEGVTLVARSAFYDCENLKKITIPASAEFVDLSMALPDVTLDSITISSASPYYTVDEYGVIYSKDMSTIYLATGDLSDVDYVISETVREVDSVAFEEKHIRSLAINCDSPVSLLLVSIDKVTFGPHISEIGYMMFAWSMIGEIIIPKNISVIDMDAFYNAYVNKAHYLGDIRELEIDSGNEALINVLHSCEYKSAISPTCISPGYKPGWYCSDCAEYIVDGEVIPATNHKDTLVQVDAKAPTCTEIGWDAYEYCTACDYSTYVEISASHEIKTVDKKDATCTEAGHEAYEYCTECTYTTYKEIPSNGHTPLEAVKENEVAPECEKAGSYDLVVYCDVCGEELDRDTTTVDALTHTDADGDYLCDHGCGHEFEKPVDPTPDEPVDDTCDHLCHKDGILGFLWKIISFLQRLFGIQQYCDCGVLHYDSPIFG